MTEVNNNYDDVIDLEKLIDSLKCEKCVSCDLQKLSEETNGFRELNGSTPPAVLAPTVDSITLLNTINADGKRVLMVKSVRKANTRVGIHIHKYGGYTIILSGTMTDFVQGIPNKEYGSNTAYYMPPCTPMSAANLSQIEDVELIDIFIGPPGEPYIEILEPDWSFQRVHRFDE